jgi:hypothetical protein
MDSGLSAVAYGFLSFSPSSVPFGLYAGAGANSDITSLSIAPPVRQTVLSGPVDTNGFASFGGATGSTTVTAAGTLIATAANGYVVGALDRIGTITNPSWTSLSTNGTMYLYIDIAAAGTCTTGSTTLAPTYRWGGADVTTNNQFTFNVQEMVGKVGNGSTAAQTYRVFVGEVTVAGAVVTAITWYQLMGRYQSADAAVPALGTTTSFNHNLGLSYGAVSLTPQPNISAWLRCYTTDSGWAVGDVVPFQMDLTSTHVGQPSGIITGRNTACTVTGGNTPIIGIVKSTGVLTVLTAANWKQFILVQRGW